MLAEWAGLLQEEPGVHTVPVKLVGTWQHAQPLQGEKQLGHVSHEEQAICPLPAEGGSPQPHVPFTRTPPP